MIDYGELLCCIDSELVYNLHWTIARIKCGSEMFQLLETEQTVAGRGTTCEIIWTRSRQLFCTHTYAMTKRGTISVNFIQSFLDMYVHNIIK